MLSVALGQKMPVGLGDGIVVAVGLHDSVPSREAVEKGLVGPSAVSIKRGNVEYITPKFDAPIRIKREKKMMRVVPPEPCIVCGIPNPSQHTLKESGICDGIRNKKITYADGRKRIALLHRNVRGE